MNERHQRSIGEETSSDERHPFVFLGGNLALDLVNTEIMVRGKREDLLVTSQNATQWWEMARQAYPRSIQEQEQWEWNEQQVLSLRTLRRALRDLFETLVAHHQTNEDQVKELNTFLREGYYSLQVSPEGKISAVYQTGGDQGSEALLFIAHAAMDLLTKQDLKRLHACQNERCMLLFYDTTKSATRHWCSIACTNRSRSIENYRKAKKALSPWP